MALGETARMIASLELEDKLSSGLKRVNAEIEKTEGKWGGLAGKVGTGLKIGAAVGVAAAAAGFGLLVNALAEGSTALREDAVIMAQTEEVIRNTGGAAGVTAAQVEALANRLALINGVDDNVVQGAENVLLAFKNISGDAFPRATQAAIDYAAATGGNAVDAAQALGKALADPAKAAGTLKRAGVVLTDQEQQQISAFVRAGKSAEAQGVILAALEGRYKGVAKAQADAMPGRRLAVAVEWFEKALSDGLVPVLDDVVRSLTDLLTRDDVMAGVKDLGKGIGDAAKGAVEFARSIDWRAVGDGIRAAAGFAKTLIGAFTSMPPAVQGAIIALAGLNKLSGGAVSSIVGELGKGLVKGVLGMTAGVVNITAGTVNGGGVGGAAGGGARGVVGTVARTAGGLAAGVGGSLLLGEAAKGGGAINAAGAAAGGAAMIGGGALAFGPLGAIVGSLAAVAQTQAQVSGQNSAQAASMAEAFAAAAPGKTNEELRTSLAAIDQGIADIGSNPLNVLVAGDALDSLRAMRDTTLSQLSAQQRGTDELAGKMRDDQTAVTGAIRSMSSTITSAVHGIKPQVTVNVSNTVSVRGMSVAQQTRAAYNRGVPPPRGARAAL